MKIANITLGLIVSITTLMAHGQPAQPLTVTLIPKEVEGTKILEVDMTQASALFQLLGPIQQSGGTGEMVDRTGTVTCSVSPNPGVGLEYQCYILPSAPAN